ncbi:MAG: hypothetical protein LC808_34715 [Actinobacteria bacterium]|nr:hypothetical protein [Actinomycetota bacterium]
MPKPRTVRHHDFGAREHRMVHDGLGPPVSIAPQRGHVFQNGAVSEVWPHGTWTVMPGRDDDFVQAWEALGDWTVRAFPGAHGTLLRDTERPNVSCGPWPDRDAVARWRAAEDLRTNLAAIRETLERFEPLLLEHVATKR